MAEEFVTAVATNEIPLGEVRTIDVRGTRIAVANVGGTFYAFDDACTHEECSLASVKVYRTRVEGDAVQIELSWPGDT